MEHVKYISAKEAAAKWNISLRRVQLLCSQGRILGTKKLGRAWMLPACANKPDDPRIYKEHRQNLSSELDYALNFTNVPMPAQNPNAILDTAKHWARLQYEAGIAYLKGDFKRTLCLFNMMEKDDALKLRSSFIAVAAVISTGDYLKFLDIEDYLKDKVRRGGRDAVIAELAMTTAAVSCIAPNLVPKWLIEGNFEDVPEQLQYLALYLRVKYFQCSGNYEAMLAAAETALIIGEPKSEITFIGIYLRLCCVCAYHALNQEDKAKTILLEAMRIGLPNGFITPFAENLTSLGGLMEKCLSQEFPNHSEAVVGQCKMNFQHWIFFHNQFTKDNLTSVLTLREHHIAQLVARRVPYKEIARQQCLSVGRVKNIMLDVYGKLLISGRDELAKYVF